LRDSHNRSAIDNREVYPIYSAMEKYTGTPADFSNVFVKLKPIFGIQPGIYLSVIYSLILVLALFFILVFPGIVNSGTLVTFSAMPGNAIIKVDDKYLGATDSRFFIKSGMRHIVIAKPFYKEISLNEKIDGSIFGSLFFPLKKNLSYQLEIEDIDGLVSLAASDFAEVGMIKDFTFDYQLPPVLSDTSRAVFAKTGSTPQIVSKIDGLLDTSRYFVDSEQELYDYAKAKTIVASKGKIFDYKSLISLVFNIIHSKQDFPNYAFWLMNSLPKSLVKSEKQAVDKFLMYKKIQQSKWFVDYEQKYFDEIKKAVTNQASSAAGSQYVDGKQYVLIPGGKLLMGDPDNINAPDDILRESLPHFVDVPRFSIASSEVTNADFYRFVLENKEWLPSNKALLEKKLVSEAYLKSWENDKPLDASLGLPVSQVSYYAANAYCAWVSKRAPAGMRVRLPYEYEWEFIAKADEASGYLEYPDKHKQAPDPAGSGTPDRFGIKNMFGNLWTWCENWFYPAGYSLYSSKKPYYFDASLKGSEKAMRGGSWANAKIDNLRSFTRGSLPPDFCTDYTGFRTVLSDR
jgi:formylglycine-generating enzyme required for sulfatase activity